MNTKHTHEKSPSYRKNEKRTENCSGFHAHHSQIQLVLRLIASWCCSLCIFFPFTHKVGRSSFFTNHSFISFLFGRLIRPFAFCCQCNTLEHRKARANERGRDSGKVRQRRKLHQIYLECSILLSISVLFIHLFIVPVFFALHFLVVFISVCEIFAFLTAQFSIGFTVLSILFYGVLSQFFSFILRCVRL